VNNPGSGTIFGAQQGRKAWKTEEVEAVSMDRMIKRFDLDRIDLLKVDIEGAEFLMFEDDSWLDIVQRIAMEVHPEFGDLQKVQRKIERAHFHLETRPAAGRGLWYVYAYRRN